MLILALLWLIVWNLGLDFETLFEGIQDMGEYFSRYGTPNFSELPHLMRVMGTTLATAFWGTMIALGLALVLAPLSARNLAPHPAVYRLGREMLNFMRAIPDLLLALLFVSAFGLGPLPGALALGIHTAGFLGKFFAESLERVDAGKYEALAATGAGFTQTVMFAGWPSISREVTSYTLYIMDRNVRAAMVLGLVGAGGIGLELTTNLHLFRYNHASAVIIVIMVTIVIIDQASTWLRERLR
ncbi:MAG TPA: phosphonate ABC transporter, permease protein PhnE [Rhodospirillales bacterium]|nr:phosphonate ABC transporter, permease protein PhnE [Rhodospirillales bacterium]